MKSYRRAYVADRRLYLDRGGRVVEAGDPGRVELLVPEGGMLPYERATELGLVQHEESEPGLGAADAVSIDHPLYAKVYSGGATDRPIEPVAGIEGDVGRDESDMENSGTEKPDDVNTANVAPAASGDAPTTGAAPEEKRNRGTKTRRSRNA